MYVPRILFLPPPIYFPLTLFLSPLLPSSHSFPFNFVPLSSYSPVSPPYSLWILSPAPRFPLFPSTSLYLYLSPLSWPSSLCFLLILVRSLLFIVLPSLYRPPLISPLIRSPFNPLPLCTSASPGTLAATWGRRQLMDYGHRPLPPCATRGQTCNNYGA